MDRFIQRMPFETDDDLALCHENGLAYQRDMTPAANYDRAYYEKCHSYEGSEIAQKINAGRRALVDKFIGQNRAVDIGVGSGEFIKTRPNTFGYDVNPVAIEWLKRQDLWADRMEQFAAYTFWDVIEHVPEPEAYFRRIQLGAFLMTSIPVMYGLRVIRMSKHYRPGEHLYYFTEQGFVDWMGLHGFMLLDRQDFEMGAGRESILSMAFKRIRWT
jgi:hypothetical protein